MCSVTDAGLTRKATVTALDVAKVIQSLPQRAEALLEVQTKTEEDPEESDDGQNADREELVNQALLEAARQALDESAETVTRDVTLNLIYRDGAWWVVPDQALLQIISGVA